MTRFCSAFELEQIFLDTIAEKDVEKVTDFFSAPLADRTTEEKLHAMRDMVFAFTRVFPVLW